MTTAGRATFDTAKGGRGKNEGNLAVLSKQYSSKDMPGHLKLKTRQLGQSTQEELVSKDFKRDLLQKEQGGDFKVPSIKPNLEASNSEYDACPSSVTSKSTHADYNEVIVPHRKWVDLPEALVNLDKDDDGCINDNSDFEPDDSDNRDNNDRGAEEYRDDSDDDDETAELLAELQRIKKERAESNLKKELDKRAQEEKIKMENTRMGNPLLNFNSKDAFVVKRRWDDDVVFKNCNPANDSEKKKSFINDTIRSEFHRKFMDKYVK